MIREAYEWQVKKEDIVSRFVELKETDPKYLRDIILSFVTAGKDTTASTLSWFLYMICKHPHIQERIAREVIQATQMSDGASVEELAAGITEETIDKMHYLHAVLTETLRLYPAAPVVSINYSYALCKWGHALVNKIINVHWVV